jgi:Leucine-rich repeat (LRR) protein
LSQLPPIIGGFYPVAPPQYINQQPTGVQQLQSNGTNFNQIILEKLDAMDNRLRKLDSIETQKTKMSQKLTLMDERVSSLERQSFDLNKQVSDIELSRQYDSQICDEIKTK